MTTTTDNTQQMAADGLAYAFVLALMNPELQDREVLFAGLTAVFAIPLPDTPERGKGYATAFERLSKLAERKPVV